jgi:hypothetical protein
MLEDPILGILRIDYTYTPVLGDIDYAGTFRYKVVYKIIPGLTFQMCQHGKLTPAVKRNCIDAVKYLNKQNVCEITGDCGFMTHIQELICEHTTRPVF